ncbi:MAG TPA: aminoglycoside phosphotransferase family protein [Streptosporangiaceae bacterium]|nr:aminoglycoside phosphotransferase family protein [Streptosporangiaceae bacterium]
MVFRDTYLQPNAPDPVLSEKAVVAAAARHVPGAGPLLEVDESGGEARAYMLAGSVVLKTQRPHRLRPRTSLAKEALFLQELDRAGEFPVPKILGYGHVEGIEYLCLTRIPGVASQHVNLDTPQRSPLLRTLGAVLRSIHQIDQTRLRASELVPGDDKPADIRQRFSDTFERLADALTGDTTWQGDLDIRQLASRLTARLPASSEPVALHSNPGPEHVFVDPSTGHFTGLIDFGDAYRSHPALDLRPWRQPTDLADLLAGYQATAPLPDGFEDVVSTCMIMAELGQVVRGKQDPQSAAARIQELRRAA